MGLGTWQKVALAAGGPNTGVHDYTNAMVYDPSQDLCLYYDGGSLTTWSWDGVDWVLLNTITPSVPLDFSDGPQVLNAALVYDAANTQVMLFGGFAGVERDNQYTWDWGTALWTEITPSPKPSARQGMGMVYDETRGEVVLFGGFNGSVALDQTWVWDGTTWTQKSPATVPQRRFRIQLVWDRARQNVVMFGGRTTGSSPAVLNTTFTWDGTDWTQEAPATQPDNRESAGMCYDSFLGLVLLFAGVVTTGSVFTADDTWAWDGSEWTDITTSVTGSPAIEEDQGPAMAYFETRREATVKKGDQAGAVIDGDTWVIRHPRRLVQVMRWH